MKLRLLKTLLPSALVVLVFWATARPAESLFRAPQQRVENRQRPAASKNSSGEEAGEQKLVYMRADNVYSIDVGDSMATCMVGNFAALHNGAVITCDSAVRYDGQTIECFGNVLINQNTTYIYGDRADYLGRINKAEVYSPLVKVIDGDATLYTFRFSFDTYKKVGEFSGGGVLFNRGNQLEADRGYYFSDTHILSCVGKVEMRDSTYELRSDSVSYNTDLDVAEFFLHTNIWNSDGDYLEGDRGSYDRLYDRYVITERGYILTPKEELWSDSLDYRKQIEHLTLRRNIQIDDTEHMTLAFGDYAEYYRDPGTALLTRNPALVGYDTSQGDTLFMRSDTILYLTTFTTRPEFNPWAPKAPVAVDSLAADSLAAAPLRSEGSTASETPTPLSDSEEEAGSEPAAEDEPAEAAVPEAKSELKVAGGDAPTAGMKLAEGAVTQTPRGEQPQPRTKVDTEREQQLLDEHAPEVRGPRSHRENIDSLKKANKALYDSLQAQHHSDSLAAQHQLLDSLEAHRQDSIKRLTDSLDTLSVKDRKAFYKRLEREKKAAEKAVKDAERREKLKVIARARQAKLTAQLNRMDSLEKLRLEKRRARMAAKLEAKRQKAIRKGKELPDSTALSSLDSLLNERERVDSLLHPNEDSLSMAADSLAVDSLALDSLARLDSLNRAADTVRRFMRGYRNVRIYRTDFQAVCDSIVGIGADSTMHLYLDPILWNESNQVTSDLMDVYTADEQVDHINFVGRPIMVSQIDTAYYNQISGKEMTAWFRQNEIYRHDVDGNVETVYFLQDNPDEPVSSVFVIRSGTASFYMENKQVVSMTYRDQNEYTMSPIEKVASMDELFLKEYKWLPERRPTRDSVFRRSIRPSVREKKERLPRPQFTTSARILRFRDRLIETGRWADRDELLSLDAQEWVRSKGFEPSEPRKDF